MLSLCTACLQIEGKGISPPTVKADLQSQSKEEVTNERIVLDEMYGVKRDSVNVQVLASPLQILDWLVLMPVGVVWASVMQNCAAHMLHLAATQSADRLDSFLVHMTA